MIKHILPTFFCLLFAFSGFAQTRPNFTLVAQPGALKLANDSWTDAEGWTHYFNNANNELLLSIKADGTDIGTIEKGLKISAGLLAKYGTEAHDLSKADYLDEDAWLVMNRYWRIEKALPIDTTISIRFYYDSKDMGDINRSLKQMLQPPIETKDVQFFAIHGRSLHPFATNVVQSNGTITFFDNTRKHSPIRTGNFGGISYAEFKVDKLPASGGGGKMIPVANGRVYASGTIKNTNGMPLSQVNISADNDAITTTDRNGFYQINKLTVGSDYMLTPSKKDAPLAGVTVLDMVLLNRYLNKKKGLKGDWQKVAADVNASDYITASDLTMMRAAILCEDTTFNGLGAWRFIPKNRADKSVARGETQTISGTIKLENIAQDTKNQDFTAIKLGNIANEADYKNNPPVSTSPSFILSDASSCGAGDTLALEMTVRDFRRLMGFQFTLQFDPNFLQFIGMEEGSLQGLEQGSFGRKNLDKGQLTVVWTTLANRGTTIRDGKVICTLKFAVNGSNGDEGEIAFGNTPTPIQVLRDNLSEANTQFTSGIIKIDNSSPIQLAKTVVKNVTCFGENDGTISFDVRGGSGKYGYKWSNQTIQPTLANLKAGDYTVTIYDPENCPYSSEVFSIKEPAKLYMSESNMKPISCPGATDGTIDITITGGTRPYSFKWSDGKKKEDRKKLSKGTYSVTIQDANGCEEYGSFFIENPGEVFVGSSISDVTVVGAKDGAIAVNKVLGGSPPYTYFWSNGETTAAVEGLFAGTYEVIINDVEGCENRVIYTVETATDKAGKFSATPQKETIVAGEPAFFEIQSPENQQLTLRLFDLKSRVISNESFSARRGKTTHYFTTPSAAGTYLVQILSKTNGIQSVRISVKVKS